MSDEFYGFGDKDFDTTALDWLTREYGGLKYFQRPNGEWEYKLTELCIAEMLDAYADYREVYDTEGREAALATMSDPLTDLL